MCCTVMLVFYFMPMTDKECDVETCISKMHSIESHFIIILHIYHVIMFSTVVICFCYAVCFIINKSKA